MLNIPKLLHSLRRAGTISAAPLIYLYERIGVIRPKLVATRVHYVTWHDPSNPNIRETDEKITFFLMEYPSGRRTYRVHEYGIAKIKSHADELVSDIIEWTYGGQMPEAAKPARTSAEIIPFEFVDTKKS